MLEARGEISADGRLLNVRDWAAAPAVGDHPARRVQATERPTSTGRGEVVDGAEDLVLRVEEEPHEERRGRGGPRRR